MVQELMFDNTPAMSPSTRQPVNQSPYGMNLQNFNYSQHNMAGYGGPDYGQYMVDCGGGGTGGLQQAVSAGCTAGCTAANTAGAWSGVYGNTGAVGGGGVPLGGGGTRPGSSPVVDDWTTAFGTSQNALMSTNSPPAAAGYGYRHAAGLTAGLTAGAHNPPADIGPYGQTNTADARHRHDADDAGSGVAESHDHHFRLAYDVTGSPRQQTNVEGTLRLDEEAKLSCRT